MDENQVPHNERQAVNDNDDNVFGGKAIRQLNGEQQQQQQQGQQAGGDSSKRKREDDDDDAELGGYMKLSKIGEGTYGVVFKARQKATNKVVALKKVRLAYSDGIPVTAMREIAILKEMKHNNVIG